MLWTMMAVALLSVSVTATAHRFGSTLTPGAALVLALAAVVFAGVGMIVNNRRG